jgi:hypothetical protein
MKAITKGALGLVGIVAASLPAAYTLGHAQDRLPVPMTAHRLPIIAVSEAFAPFAKAKRGPVSNTAMKGDRLAKAPCGQQNWPYISPECLVRAGRSEITRPIRMVTAEYRLGDDTSVLVRTPEQQLAQR